MISERAWDWLWKQIEEELDKADQVAAPATAVAVEQVLGGIDVEGGARLLV